MTTPLATPLPSPREMAAWDRGAIEGGVPSLELMERAGRGIADEVVAERNRSARSGPVLILCGPGNNGGDGLVVARALYERGIPVRVVAAGAARYSDDFQVNAKRFVALGGVIEVFEPVGTVPTWGATHPPQLSEILGGAALVVDALLGTGQTQPPRGTVGQLVEALRWAPAGCRVVAIDIPTGTNADTGEVGTPAVRADLTIAVQYMKRGLTQLPARERCGETRTIDIGIAPTGASEFSLLTTEATVLPPRELGAHKGDFGHVLVVGGSPAMPGAPVLAGCAALRMGAGWVSVAHPAQGDLPAELMVVPLNGAGGRSFLQSDAPAVLDAVERSAAVVVGPGLGRGSETEGFLRALLTDPRSTDRFFVLDADALNALAGWSDAAHVLLKRRVVLTPHPGEAGRLLGLSTGAVQADRFSAAREISVRYGGVVALKGAGTVVYGAGEGYVCPYGTPHLATPGSGDVLAGMIAALGAHGFSTVEAAARGVVIHARAGELAHAERGGFLIASDITAALGKAVRFR